MSLVDWTRNPGGIFRGATGTNWSVVWETWASWFLPTLLLAGLIALPVVLWYSRRK